MLDRPGFAKPGTARVPIAPVSATLGHQIASAVHLEADDAARYVFVVQRLLRAKAG